MYNTLKDFSNHINQTPQTQLAFGKNQVQSKSGGYVFKLDDWQLLDRFLILGSAGTYYASGHELTQEAAEVVIRLLATDGIKVVDRIVEISKSGRAPKNDPALFALALACSVPFATTPVRKYAFSVLPEIARIGTHLFHFVEYINGMRGWGRTLREGIANWYDEKNLDKLTYQVLKYRQRDGWSHKDLLKLAHPLANNEYRNKLYNYIINGDETIFYESDGNSSWINRIMAHENIKMAKNKQEVVDLIVSAGLTRESVPTKWLNSVDVWTALRQHMPVMATVRSLAKMTSIGLLKPFSDATNDVVAQLTNDKIIEQSRVHPMSIGLALLTYKLGHGFRGHLTWNPVSKIEEALEHAFYASMNNIIPSNKNLLIAIDVSGSMRKMCAGYPISCDEASAMMAVVLAKTESNSEVVFFERTTHRDIQGRTINANTSLAEACSIAYRGGGTDCSSPIQYADTQKLDIDGFVILSDNESWAGDRHVFQALQDYRKHSGKNAKLVVANMAYDSYSIADPEDGLSLNCVGLDTSLLSIISDFMRD